MLSSWKRSSITRKRTTIGDTWPSRTTFYLPSEPLPPPPSSQPQQNLPLFTSLVRQPSLPRSPPGRLRLLKRDRRRSTGSDFTEKSMTRVAPDSIPALSPDGVLEADADPAEGSQTALDKIAQKRAAQHLETQQAAVDFIESTIGRKLPHESLYESLRNGVILCELMNKLRPGSISIISTRDAPFLQMENINRFLTASKQLGLKGQELFQTVDLFEGKDMQQVVITILTIARVIAGAPLKTRPPEELNPYRNEVIIHEPVPELPPKIHTKSASASHMSAGRPQTGGIKKTESESNVRAPRARTESPHRSSSRPGSRSSSVRGAKNLGERITVGTYQLGQAIGKGQFGTVYTALNTATGQVVAIKRVSLADRKQEGVRELMQEVELLESLTHPNIVKYLGFVLQEGYLNIVLEFMECGSVLALMKKFGYNIPEELASVYVEAILEGLKYLHERGVVHCDLKCANILTTKDMCVKLTDFGVSKQLNGVGEDEQAVAGTPYWMAPEIIELKGASTASDIWSLGCTIIEMLTGKPPYLDLKNPMTALFRIVEDESPPLPPDISDELLDFFDKCFQRDISKRWTAAALLKHEWIRKKYQDPQIAEESALLMEAGKQIIQNSAITPTVTPMMDTIPEPGPSTENSEIQIEPSPLPNTTSPLTPSDSFNAHDESSTTSASGAHTPASSELFHAPIDTSQPEVNKSDSMDTSILNPPEIRGDLQTGAGQVPLRPCRSAPDVQLGIVNDPEDELVKGTAGMSLERAAGRESEVIERIKRKKTKKRMSIPGSSKDKDCSVM